MRLHYESGTTLKRLLRERGLAAVRLYLLPILSARWQRFQWLLEMKPGRALFRYVPLFGLLFSHAFVVSGRKHKSGDTRCFDLLVICFLPPVSGEG